MFPYCTETPKHYNRYYDALQQPLFGALLQLKVTPVAFTEAQLATKWKPHSFIWTSKLRTEHGNTEPPQGFFIK